MKKRFGCFKNLFRRRPEIIKTVNADPFQLSEEMREDQKKMFTNPIRHGNRKRGRRPYGRIISYPATWKHREGVSWLYDKKEK